MGILKVLGKVVETIAFSPIPEYIGFVGSVCKVLSIARACDVAPVTTKIVWEDNIPSVDEYKNPTPADAIEHLHPFFGEFSVRKAMNEYHKLDVDGKVSVVAYCVSSVCGAIYAFNSLVRAYYVGKYYGDYAVAENKLDFMRKEIHRVAETTKEVGDSISKCCDGDISDINMYRNYRNYMAISGDLRDILDRVAHFNEVRI